MIDTVAWRGKGALSVWTNRGFPLYVSGSFTGGFFQNTLGDWNEIDLGVACCVNRIRGTGLNNIFAVGQGGLLAHYNGIEWKILDVLDRQVNLHSISVAENIMVAVGTINDRAIAIIGRQN